MTKTPFHSTERIIKPSELIHSDIFYLKFMQTRGRKKYFITFDDCIRYCLKCLIFIKEEVENQLNTRIKAIRSDRGGEYGPPFEQFCLEHDIIHKTTSPYSPESNGIAKRKNRTLKEMMNAMLISLGLPQNLWGEALLATNYLLNRIPHKKLQNITYENGKE